MKHTTNILLSCLALLCITALVVSQDNLKSFKQKIADYIDKNKTTQVSTDLYDTTEYIPYQQDTILLPLTPFDYTNGDWNRYVINQKYTLNLSNETNIHEETIYDLIAYGSMNLNFKYGKSFFTSNKYRQFDNDQAITSLIQPGFSPDYSLQLHLEGKIGKRLTLYIDHDSNTRNNTYIMQYKAVNDDEILREINAGDINIKVNNSKYAVYDDTNAKGLGLDFTLKKNKLKLKFFGSVSKGISETEYFKGIYSNQYIILSEYQYVKSTYFQLEPFKRYDNLDTSPADITTTIAWTSMPPNPETYTPYMVNIDSPGFEMYMDDANSTHIESPLIVKDPSQSIILGYFKKLQRGSDYTINYSTGTITLLRQIKPQAKIFAVYTRNGGSTITSDPNAIVNHPQFTGKILVFIKYGTSAESVWYLKNIDVHEMRGIYATGLQQLRSNDVKITFFNNSLPMSKIEIAKLGKFTIDYSSGIISFFLREPFKSLLSDTAKQIIYNNTVSSQGYTVSQYKISVSGYSQSNGFQLKHTNIIPDTLRIKINGQIIQKSLYSLDPTSGLIQFNNPNNPTITQETEIEITYQYLPFEGIEQQFIGGFRTDYQLTKNIAVGSTLLYRSQGIASSIPFIGNEPTQTTIAEIDSSIQLHPKEISQIVSKITDIDSSIPVSINGYVEYAKSYHNINTFGKGLIDDFESIYSGLTLSMSEKDWILGALPQGVSENQRGKLFYRFYRDIYNPQNLYGFNFIPADIPYSIKPGPYNIATGHISNLIHAETSQVSIALSYELPQDGYISIVTRKLFPLPADLSDLQYIEIWYRIVDGSSQVNMYLDIGKINEDSDGDGFLDTEDANKNGYLDFDINRGQSEDIGYQFDHPLYPTKVGSGPGLSYSTTGDGILNTEDLNDNGMLDNDEEFIRIPGLITPITIMPNTNGWQKARIYLNKNNASEYTSHPEQLEDILRSIYSIRVLLYNPNSSTIKGTILIDSIRLATLQWKVTEINGISSSSSDQLSVTLIDSANDPEYYKESFSLTRHDIYTNLYGIKNIYEIFKTTESSIQVAYNGITSGCISRKYFKPLDLRYYKNIHCWINMRSFQPDDLIYVRLESSPNDYFEYEYKPQFNKFWVDVILSLQGHLTNTTLTTVKGNPDLKRIIKISLIVKNNNTTSGSFWIDDIYASDPQIIEDTAHWYECTTQITRPLAYTASGTPIFSDIKLNFINKGHGNNFYTIGQVFKDISEQYNQASLSFNILPYWSANCNAIKEQSSTDSLNETVEPSKRGDTVISQIFFSTFFNPPEHTIPSITFNYQYDDYQNHVQYIQSSNNLNNYNKTNSHTLSLGLQQSINDIFKGELSYKILCDTSFKEHYSNENYQFLLQGFSEIKKQRQALNIDVQYKHTHFFIQPHTIIGSEEYVTYHDTTSTSNVSDTKDFQSGYHVPFLYNNISFIERLKKLELKTGLEQYQIVNPSISLDISYFENQFNDLTQSYNTWINMGFNRTRNTQVFLSNTLSLPISLSKYIPSLKTCSITYYRTGFLAELNVPYEGEKKYFYEEKFGISRIMSNIANPIYNFIYYPPWYFFKGRSNYANSRDFTTHTLSDKPSIHSIIFDNYNNYFKLIDNASFAINWELSPFNLFNNFSINSLSERNGVDTPAQQVVSYIFTSTLSLDLMKIFSFGFFRPNRPDAPYHSSTILFEYQFNKYLRITSNILQNEHTPSIGITFKSDRTSWSSKFGISLRTQQWHEFIPIDPIKRAQSDNIYFNNLTSTLPYSNTDKGYTFSSAFETDITMLYNLLSRWYILASYPIFRIEYLMNLNRYNYTYFTSPEPYDLYNITSSFTLNVHKNIQGSIVAKCFLEKYHNRINNDVNREIISYSIDFQLSILF